MFQSWNKDLTDWVCHLVVDGELAERKGGHQVDPVRQGQLDEAHPPVEDQPDAVLLAVGSLQSSADHKNCRLALGNPETRVILASSANRRVCPGHFVN